jgi:hypothetical protein
MMLPAAWSLPPSASTPIVDTCRSRRHSDPTLRPMIEFAEPGFQTELGPSVWFGRHGDLHREPMSDRTLQRQVWSPDVLGHRPRPARCARVRADLQGGSLIPTTSRASRGRSAIRSEVALPSAESPGDRPEEASGGEAQTVLRWAPLHQVEPARPSIPPVLRRPPGSAGC